MALLPQRETDELVSTTLLCPRRAFLSWCLGVLALGRRLFSATATQKQQYRSLTTPVVLPLEAIEEPWSALAFEARLSRNGLAAGDALLAGILLHIGGKGALSDHSGSDAAGRVQAFCLLCPHEICHVDYQTDTSQVRLDAGVTPGHPLLVCPCHFSVFNPVSDGALISGPAYRGLYRFKVQLEQDIVKITQVEEGVLTLFDTVSPEEEPLTLLDTVVQSREE